MSLSSVILIGCFEKKESKSIDKMLNQFENGWISKTSYKGDSSAGSFPIQAKDLKFNAAGVVYKRDTLEYCHPKYDVSFENSDSLQLDIEVCWNGQSRFKLIKSNQIKRFDDGNEMRFSPTFDSVFQNAQKKWGTDIISVTVPEISSAISECNNHGFICQHPKLPCNSPSGFIPIWYIQNATNKNLVHSLKSRYGKGKIQGKDCTE